MIIGLTGSFGAGKGEVVKHLIERGFKHYSASGFIREEVVRRGLVPDRDSFTVVANSLRAQFGPSYIIDTLYKRAEEEGGDVLIEALRAVAEVRRIKELGGVVFGVDAEPRIRYDRSVARGSEKDHVSFERWIEQEHAETNPDDPTKQDVFGALRESDAVLNNNGTLEELHTQIDEALKRVAQ